MWGFNGINLSCEYCLTNLRIWASVKNPLLPDEPVCKAEIKTQM